MAFLARAAANTGADGGRPRRKASQISFHETSGAPAVVRYASPHPLVARPSVADPSKTLIVRAKSNLPPELQHSGTEDDRSDFEIPRGTLVDRAIARASPQVVKNPPGGNGRPKATSKARASWVIEEEEDSEPESEAYQPPSDDNGENDFGEAMVPTDVSDEETFAGKGKGKRAGKKTKLSQQPPPKARKLRADQRVAFQTVTTASHTSLRAEPARRLQRELSFANIPHAPNATERPARRGAGTALTGVSSAGTNSLLKGATGTNHSLGGASEETLSDPAMDSARGSSVEDDYEPACRQQWTTDRRGRLHVRLSSIGPEKAHLDAARNYVLNYITAENPWPSVEAEDQLIRAAWVETFDPERDLFTVCPSLAGPLYKMLKNRMSIFRSSLFGSVKDSVIDWYSLGPPPRRQEQVRQLLGDFTWLYSHVNDEGKRVGAFGHKAILRTIERFFFGHGSSSYGCKFPTFEEEVPSTAIALVGTALYAALKSFDASSSTAALQFTRKDFGNVYNQVMIFYDKKYDKGALPFGHRFPERLRSQAAASMNAAQGAPGVVVGLDDDDDDTGGDGFDPWANEA